MDKEDMTFHQALVHLALLEEKQYLSRVSVGY